MTYEEWYNWALVRFGDETKARVAARAAAEVQQVGAPQEAAQRAAASAVDRQANESAVFVAPDPVPDGRPLPTVGTPVLPTHQRREGAPPTRVPSGLKLLWIGGSALLACSVAVLGIAIIVITKRPVVQVSQPTGAVVVPSPSPTDTAYPNMVPSIVPQPTVAPVALPAAPVQGAAPAQTTTRTIIVQAPPVVTTQPPQPAGPALFSTRTLQQTFNRSYDAFSGQTFDSGQTDAFTAQQQQQQPPGTTLFKVNWQGNMAISTTAGDFACITYIDLLDVTSNVSYRLGASQLKVSGTVQSTGVPTGHKYSVRLTNCSSQWTVSIYE